MGVSALLDAWVVAQFAVALAMLGVGAYSDLKTHEISNRVWVVGGVLGFILAAFHYQGNPMFLGIHMIFAALIFGAMFACWLLVPSKIGAADVKAGTALGMILSSLAFLNLFWAFLAIAYFMGAKFLKSKKAGWRSLMSIQAPFIPFLLVGCVLTFVSVLVV